MKNIFYLINIIILTSCSSYYEPKQKNEVYYSPQYEGGDKDAGVIYMYFTFNPNTEIPKMDLQATEENAGQICRNWGFSGEAKLQSTDATAKCIQFNFNNGDCIRYKVPVKMICQ